MKAKDVTVGEVYAVKVGGRECPVQISGRGARGGFTGVNKRTGRTIRIKTAGRLRYRWGDADHRREYRDKLAESERKAHETEVRNEQARQRHTLGQLPGQPNRILDAIGRAEDLIKRNPKGATAQQIADTERNLDMNLPEFVRFQELKSRGMLQGRLNHSEAQTIYAALGESVGHFNSQPLAVKIVLTQVFEELLTAQIGKRGM